MCASFSPKGTNDIDPVQALIANAMRGKGANYKKRAGLLQQAFAGAFGQGSGAARTVAEQSWRAAWGEISADAAMEAMRHYYREEVLQPPAQPVSQAVPPLDASNEDTSDVTVLDASNTPGQRQFWHKPPQPVLSSEPCTGINRPEDCYNDDPSFEIREAERLRAESIAAAERHAARTRWRNSGNGGGGSGGPEDGGGCGSGGGWMR